MASKSIRQRDAADQGCKTAVTPLNSTAKRLVRERKTIEAMIVLFCRDHHGVNGKLCIECAGLWAYAQQRLIKCPYGEDKPTCVKCSIHCYKAAARDRVKAVMRYAGPRLVYRRPILVIQHLLDERKTTPEAPRRKGSAHRPD
jgi:hypothetical protein